MRSLQNPHYFINTLTLLELVSVVHLERPPLCRVTESAPTQLLCEHLELVAAEVICLDVRLFHRRRNSHLNVHNFVVCTTRRITSTSTPSRTPSRYCCDVCFATGSPIRFKDCGTVFGTSTLIRFHVVSCASTGHVNLLASLTLDPN